MTTKASPNPTPTPRLLGLRPGSAWGSLQSSSHMRPSSGGSLHGQWTSRTSALGPAAAASTGAQRCSYCCSEGNTADSGLRHGGLVHTGNRSMSFASLPVAVNCTDVVKLDAILAEEAAMHHQHLAVEHMGQRQLPERLRKQLDQLSAVLLLHLQVVCGAYWLCCSQSHG